MIAYINSKEFKLMDEIKIKIKEYDVFLNCSFILHIWLNDEKYYEFETYDEKVELVKVVNEEGSLIDIESIEWDFNEGLKSHIEIEFFKYPSLSDNNRTIIEKVRLDISEIDEEYYLELLKRAEEKTVEII